MTSKSIENDFPDEFFDVTRSHAEIGHDSDEPERHPGQPSPEQGLSEFFKEFDDEQLEALAAACGKLAEAQREGTRQFFKRSGDSTRAAATMQLEAAIQFIEAFTRGGGMSTLPLQELLLALMGLDEGAVAPIVEPRTPSNRAPDTMLRKTTKMYAAITMELWIEIGSDKRPPGEAFRRPAAEAVAKILGQAGLTIKRTLKTIDWKTVSEWRDEVHKKVNQEPDSPFALTYNRVLEEGREHLGQLRRDGADDREIRKSTLDSLALFLVKHGESYNTKVIDRFPVLAALAGQIRPNE
jgi:hypothetical protein